METERMALSQRERDRLRVLQEVERGHLTQVEGARRIHLCDRQVRRLLLRLREQGDRAGIHGLRGRPSSRVLIPVVDWVRIHSRLSKRLRKGTDGGLIGKTILDQSCGELANIHRLPFMELRRKQ